MTISEDPGLYRMSAVEGAGSDFMSGPLVTANLSNPEVVYADLIDTAFRKLFENQVHIHTSGTTQGRGPHLRPDKFDFVQPSKFEWTAEDVELTMKLGQLEAFSVRGCIALSSLFWNVPITFRQERKNAVTSAGKGEFGY